MTVIGLLHPGQMGASVGAAALLGANEVLWSSDGRSGATAARADAAGLTDVGNVVGVVEKAELILSVCPPDRAVDVASLVADCGFSGIYVDANAVSPATAESVRLAMAGCDADVIDGSIIGPPAWVSGTTRLYVAGTGAEVASAAFRESALEVIVLNSGYGSASALKMAYAGWTKGSAALAMSVVAFAASAGVDDVLFDEWRVSQPEMLQRARSAALATSPKAWRFVGEMHEIAAALLEAGLPGGFHEGAAQTYERLKGFRDHPDGADLDEVVEALLSVSRSRDRDN